MALLYEYPDAYLNKFCVEEREARAIDDVALMAGDRTFDADWTERLVRLQVYILACLEHQREAEDLFAIKLKAYREELALQLPRAREAADEAADEDASSVYSFPMARG